MDATAAAAAGAGALDGSGTDCGDAGGGPLTAGPPTIVRRRGPYSSAATVAGGAAQGWGLCNGSQASPSSLCPAVLLPEVVRHAPASGLLKAIFTRLLPHRLDAFPPYGGGGGGCGSAAVSPPVPAREWPRSLYGGDMWRAGDGTNTGYRSKVAPPWRRPSPDALVEALTYLASKRLSRPPPPPSPPLCVLPVTLLQPQEVFAANGGGGGQRDI